MTNYNYQRRRRRKRKISKIRCLMVLVVAGLIVFCSMKAFDFIADLSGDNTKTVVTTDTEKKDTPKPVAAKVEPLTSEVKATPAPHDYSVLINKGEHKIYLLDKDEKIAVWGCAIGKGGAGQKQKSGDNMTPNGTFTIDEIDDASYWTHDFGDGKGEIKNAYGPWFLSLDTKNISKGNWDGIGIHGTHDPNSIGTNASEGCIRMNNDMLLKLKKYVKVGTKVVIVE